MEIRIDSFTEETKENERTMIVGFLPKSHDLEYMQEDGKLDENPISIEIQNHKKDNERVWISLDDAEILAGFLNKIIYKVRKNRREILKTK